MRMTTPKEVRMRGDDQEQQGAMWSYVPMERRIPADHPLRRMRPMVDGLLQELSPRFEELYSRVGRPSIAPEKLLRALLLQVLYTIRSERLLMDQRDYNLLVRWFVGLEMDDPIWNPTVFTKNRERLLAGEIARAFFDRVVAQARERGLLSDEHFTVDGTLVEAWASLKSFKRKDAPAPPPDDPGNPTVNFHGERRSNATHASTTDPDARLFRKGDAHEAKLYYTGHVLMENRHGLAVDGCVTPASGHAERAAALELVGTQDREGGVTLGADKSYDTRDFVQAVRLLGVTPHVAQNTSKRASAIDGRTTRHRGYRVSQRRADPERLVAGRDSLDVVEGIAEAALPVLPGRSRHVRRDRHGVEGEERVVRGRWLLQHDVEARAGEPAGRERLIERRLIDDRAAAGVDQDRARLHQGERLLAHHPTRPVGEWHVQAHDVRGAQQLLEEDEPDAERVLRVLGEPHDVVVLDVHVEAEGAAGHLLADVAESHDPERLPRELGEARRREVTDPPLAGDDVVVLPDELLRHGQHERERVLGDGDRVGSAVVADGDPRLSGRLDVDPVVAGADGLAELELRRRAVEVRPEARAGEADEVLGVVDRVEEFGRSLLGDPELVACRHDRAGDLDHRAGQLR